MKTVQFALLSVLCAGALQARADIPQSCEGTGALKAGVILQAAYQEKPAALFVLYSRDGRFCASARIPVAVRQSECAGVRNLGFATGGSDLASGSFEGLSGHRLTELFTAYNGKASGLGAVIGYGRWNAVSAQGISVGDKRLAVPLPTLGGDIAIGATKCEYSLEISAIGDALVSSRPGDTSRESAVGLNSISNWEF